MKKKFLLNRKRSIWLRMVTPSDAYEKYKKLHGEMSQSNFHHFLQNPKAAPGADWSVWRDYDEAMRVLKSIGVTTREVESADAIPLMDNDCSDANLEDSFFERCGELLWNNQIGSTAIADDEIQERALEVLDCVMERKTSFSLSQRRTILGPLTDFLLETRNYTRWSAWVEAMLRDSLHEFARCPARGWFPDWRNAGENRFLQKAFEVRCLGLKINALRHEKFCLWLKSEELKTKMAEAEIDAVGLDRQKLDNDAEQKKCKDRIRQCFRIAYVADEKHGAQESLIFPVVEDVAMSELPDATYFILACARLFLDWSKYHISGTGEGDFDAAMKMLGHVQNWCEGQIRKLASRVNRTETFRLKQRFHYILSNVFRLQASNGIWPRCGYCLEKYEQVISDDNRMRELKKNVWHAEEAVKDAFDNANQARMCCEKGAAESSAARYRMLRNFVRIATFAARWSVKFRRHEELSYGWLAEAFDVAKKSLCAPLGPMQENSVKTHNGRPVVLRMKRKLEYEFHLRTQIELIVDEFRIAPPGQRSFRDMDEDRLCEKPNLTQANQVKLAFCEILIIYCYLFPPSKGSFLHQSMLAAKKWITLQGSNVPRIYAPRIDVGFLEGTRQECPPDEQCRCEILCTLRWDLSGKHCRGTVLWGAISKLAKRSEDSFARDILIPSLSGLKDDFAKLPFDNAEFVQSTIFNLANSPGSNDAEIYRIVTQCRKGF